MLNAGENPAGTTLAGTTHADTAPAATITDDVSLTPTPVGTNPTNLEQSVYLLLFYKKSFYSTINRLLLVNQMNL